MPDRARREGPAPTIRKRLEMSEIPLYVGDADRCHVPIVSEEIGGTFELPLELLKPAIDSPARLRLLPKVVDAVRLEPPTTLEPVDDPTALRLSDLVRLRALLFAERFDALRRQVGQCGALTLPV